MSTRNNSVRWVQIGSVAALALACSGHPDSTGAAPEQEIGNDGDGIDNSPDELTVAPRKGVVYTADFETGAIQKRTSPEIDATTGSEKNDAGYLKGMAPPLDGTCTPVSTTNGGGSITSNEYTRVMSSTNAPVYTGTRSLRMQIPYDCDYNPVNGGEVGDIGGEKDKARTGFAVNGLKLPFDQYVWLAWAMYVPASWEIETESVQTHLFQVPMGPSGSPGPYNFDVADGDLLQVEVGINATGVSHVGQTQKILANLDFKQYRGRWVTVITRVRFNPFTSTKSTSGIAGSTGKTYSGNRGSLELWLDGRKVVNYRGPLGYVPSPEGWTIDMLVYKGSWKKKPSSVKGPIKLFYDSIRIGLESKGAGYKDVHPKQIACSQECP